jgi:hypothetical protein
MLTCGAYCLRCPRPLPRAYCRAATGEGAGQNVRQAVIDETKISYPRQRGVRLNPGQLTIESGDGAHRESRGKDTALAGGHDSVADFQRHPALLIMETWKL